MRKLLAVAAVFAAFAAPAVAGMPTTGSYGTNLGCAYVTNSEAFGDVETIFYVTPYEVVGMEWACEPLSAEGAEVSLSCYGEGEKWTMQATISEDAAAGTLTYSDGPVRVTLSRCD